MRKQLIILSLIIIISCDSKEEAPKQQEIAKSVETESENDTTVEKPNVPEQKTNQKKKTKSIPQQSLILKENQIKSITELWQTYKKSKVEATKALEKEDLETVITQLELAGESSLDLGRPEIAAWQFNNIGHYSIQEFKKRTSYDRRLQELATMTSGKSKSEYIQTTKALFKKELPLLERAEKYLQKAQIIDDNLEPSRRSNVIQSNIEYIDWVKGFAE